MAGGLNKGTFANLNPKDELFEEIKKQQPEWWEIFREDKELYIHIRKDNYINVYYNGGSVARIEFKNGDFSAKIHKKYFPFESDLSNVAKNSKYIEVDIRDIAKNLKDIKNNIKIHYSDWNLKSEGRAEKWLQSKLILKDPNRYIDSQFAYNDEKLLIIDLVELSPDGKLSFTELKRLSDDRLESEIIGQMETYKKFVSDNDFFIVAYYKKLIQLRRELQLYAPFISDIILNPTLNLLIVDTSQKDKEESQKEKEERENKTKNIKKLLDDHKIKYEIKSLSEI